MVVLAMSHLKLPPKKRKFVTSASDDLPAKVRPVEDELSGIPTVVLCNSLEPVDSEPSSPIRNTDLDKNITEKILKNVATETIRQSLIHENKEVPAEKKNGQRSIHGSWAGSRSISPVRVHPPSQREDRNSDSNSSTTLSSPPSPKNIFSVQTAISTNTTASITVNTPSKNTSHTSEAVSPDAKEKSSPCQISPNTSKDPDSLTKHIVDPKLSLMLLHECQMAVKQDEDGDLPIHIAVVHENIEMVQKLLKLLKMAHPRVAIDTYNKLRQTPLHLAVLTNQTLIVRYLLEESANPNMPDRNGQTCIHLAAKNDYIDVLRTLIKYSRWPLDLNMKNFEGLTPLHVAVLHGASADIIIQLATSGAAVNRTDGKSGRTALFHAVENNQLVSVKALLANGADPNCSNYSNNTPLSIASGREFSDIALVLIRHGADTSIKLFQEKKAGLMSEYEMSRDLRTIQNRFAARKYRSLHPVKKSGSCPGSRSGSRPGSQSGSRPVTPQRVENDASPYNIMQHNMVRPVVFTNNIQQADDPETVNLSPPASCSSDNFNRVSDTRQSVIKGVPLQTQLPTTMLEHAGSPASSDTEQKTVSEYQQYTVLQQQQLQQLYALLQKQQHREYQQTVSQKQQTESQPNQRDVPPLKKLQTVVQTLPQGTAQQLKTGPRELETSVQQQQLSTISTQQPIPTSHTSHTMTTDSAKLPSWAKDTDNHSVIQRHAASSIKPTRSSTVTNSSPSTSSVKDNKDKLIMEKFLTQNYSRNHTQKDPQQKLSPVKGHKLTSPKSHREKRRKMAVPERKELLESEKEAVNQLLALSNSGGKMRTESESSDRLVIVMDDTADGNNK